MTAYAPDRRLEYCDIDTYIVPAGQTVHAGAPVKISALDNPNPTDHKGYVCQEATAASDISIGVAQGDVANPRQVFTEGQYVRVVHLIPWVGPAVAKGIITAGQRVVATSGGGFAAAPAWNNAGSTNVFSPGLALNSATDGQAFTFMPLPTSYVAA